MLSDPWSFLSDHDHIQEITSDHPGQRPGFSGYAGGDGLEMDTHVESDMSKLIDRPKSIISPESSDLSNR